MQAVFLLAGQGTRLRPLTYETPKPLLQASGKTLVEHNLDNLPAEIDELIFIVSYMQDKIRDYFGDNYKGKKITYCEQKQLLGTGQAIHECKGHLKDRFVVLMGDDLYSRVDMEKCLRHERCMLVKELARPFAGGRITLDEKGNLQGIEEGEHKEPNNLVNTGFYVMGKEYFDYEMVKLAGKNEYGLPQTLVKVAKDYPIAIEKAEDWIQINNLEELERAREMLGNRN